MIDACTAHLRMHHASGATCVGLRIGALANVDPEALRFCFDSLKKDTPLADACALDIRYLEFADGADDAVQRAS